MSGFDRRRFMRRAGSALAAASAGLTLFPRTVRPAQAAASDDNVVRIMGVTTGAPADWAEFERDTGLKAEWTPIGDDVGIFLHEMLANDAGEQYDLVTCLSGTSDVLAEQGMLMPIDAGKLSNWADASPLVRSFAPAALDAGSLWSVPFQLNADAFAYCWKDLGEPDAPAEVSWKLLFDDPRTLGKSVLDAGIYTIADCAIYLKYNKLVDIANVARMTASECDTVASFLIERKRAGQFRTFFKSYDEQVQLLTTGEALAITCWEPATLEAQGKGVAVAHAYTIEGYDKWAQNLMIPAEVAGRGGADKVHRTIDWFLGGAYAAEKSVTQGYITPRLDLGLAYAIERGWSADKLASIRATEMKLAKKFAKSLYADPGYFDTIEYYERAMEKFKNA